MQYHQINMFEMFEEKYKLNRKIRLISLFSGYDSQALSLKYLGVPYEHYKCCEWAVKSIQALKDIHYPNDNTDYSAQYSKEELIEILYNLGISTNYNDPCTREQIKKMDVRKIYNNIKATNNLVSVVNVKGGDLGITDTDKYDYILTYSFP